jgi:sulfur carrier protein
MDMIVNGKPVQVEGAATVSQLLEQLGFAGKRVAVEKNGEIVPKSQHGSTAIAASDKIEIVVAVGGG